MVLLSPRVSAHRQLLLLQRSSETLGAAADPGRSSPNLSLAAAAESTRSSGSELRFRGLRKSQARAPPVRAAPLWLWDQIRISADRWFLLAYLEERKSARCVWVRSAANKVPLLQNPEERFMFLALYTSVIGSELGTEKGIKESPDPAVMLWAACRVRLILPPSPVVVSVWDCSSSVILPPCSCTHKPIRKPDYPTGTMGFYMFLEQEGNLRLCSVWMLHSWQQNLLRELLQ
ncbi:hypothetical protein GOODEAATRI_003747 [Goodea atripinnis]|uniref:Uncharacterized protein n=1 Tax=Goodea atripinnis TaxID=208336 RepID=A0ABV0P2T5_9TELE